MAVKSARSSGVLSCLYMELRGWARYLLPSKYVATYYPTPQHVAKAMLQLAAVTSRDVVYDLGCGDGRILIIAAEEFGARGFGIELDPQLVKKADEVVAAKRLSDRVAIRHGDALGLDVSDATALALYLSDSGNRKLLDNVVGMRGGTRVVSLYFPVKGWEQQLQKMQQTQAGVIYMYVASAKEPSET